MKSSTTYRILFLLMVLALGACNTKKNTFMRRAYHGTTARFNGYFNARELIRKNVRTLEDSHQEDYSRYLPIFIYPTEQQSQSMYPDMDKAIEKCSNVIDRHSMYIRRKEHNKWIDDSYFLIGKARFYKDEKSLAEETFLYVYQAYKKEPIRYNALLWLLRTYVQARNWEKVETFIELAEEDTKFPKELRGEFNAIYADFLIKRDEDYVGATEKLEDAVKFTKIKKDRRRYTYILAQIYQKKRELKRATELYGQVIKMRPDYIMEFNAKINRAIAYDASTGDSESIKKQMRKMLRDRKNEEFYDQIYYALAELALKEDDEPLAIDYLKKSIQTSQTNTKQKAFSYYRLAGIYFDQPNYVPAQAYYDSTLQFLPKDHPDYYEAENKNNSLTDLVKNLKIIELQDSLLALSELSEKEQKKAIKKIIAAKKEEKAKQVEQAALRATANDYNTNNRRNRSNNSSGGWYFYNTTTLAFGVSEFQRLWGNRKLEDNWRRSDKQSFAPELVEKKEGTPDGETQQESSNLPEFQPETYLKDIPNDRPAQLAAHGKLVEALFNVGTIFKESFEDYPSAVKAFNRLTSDYDTSRFNLPAHYQLYRIYTIADKEEKAQIEKDWILDNYPFSEYAYLIKNPNYSKETKATKEKIEEFYAATYRLYDYGLYRDVINSCIKADTLFMANNHIEAKFDFLKAKAIGKSRPKAEFKKAIEDVIADHPKDAVEKEAKEILRFINKGPATNTGPVFKYEPKKKHVFIFSIPKSKTGTQDLKIALSDFNKNYFREKKLSFTTAALDNATLFVVRTFDNQEDARRYLRALQNNIKLIMQFKTSNATEYIISTDNFGTLFRKRNEKEYLEFYRQKYPA